MKLQPRHHNQKVTRRISVNTTQATHAASAQHVPWLMGCKLVLCFNRNRTSTTEPAGKRQPSSQSVAWLVISTVGGLCTCQQQGLYGPLHGRLRCCPAQSPVHTTGAAFFSTSIPARHSPRATPQTIGRVGDDPPWHRINGGSAAAAYRAAAPRHRVVLRVSEAKRRRTHRISGVMLLQAGGPLHRCHSVLHLPCSGC